jgi:putative DNA primase/helicase
MRQPRQRVDATELARNHWRYVLTQLGVPEAALTGKHGPCPACGGEDRFRFDNRNGEGSHYCSGCGAGSGYQLLMKVHGWDFNHALKEVQRLISPDMPAEKPPAGMNPEQKRRLLREAWGAGSVGAPEVIHYLCGRGLGERVATYAAQKLRYGPVYHKDSDSYQPCMMALVEDADRTPVTIHRTYLMGDRREKRTMPCLHELNGSAIRFSTGEPQELVLAEGIETTLAAMQLHRRPGWATVSANGMATLELPRYVKRVIICADNDAKFAGQAAAYALAHRLACKVGGPEVEVRVPERVGWDFLDVLSACASVPS